MTSLATDRTVDNTRDEHVSDHNIIAQALNLLTSANGIARSLLDASTQASLAKADTASQWPSTHAISSNTTAVYGDIYYVDTSGGAVTVTLPTAVANRPPITIKKISSDGNAVTVTATSGSIEFSGGSKAFAGRGTSYTLGTNGTDWFVN